MLLNALAMWKKRKDSEMDTKAFKLENLNHFVKLCNRLEKKEASECREYTFVPKTLVLDIQQAFEEQHDAINFKLTPFQMVVIFLQFVTGGESFCSISRRIGITKTSISTIISKVSNVINMRMSSIHCPETPEQWRAVENSFDKKNMLRALGSLDGKHIRIRAPPSSGSLFYNYKNFFSFVLLALVDANGRFLWIDIGTPGSVNDASIYNQSDLKGILSNGSTLPLPSYWSQNVVMPSFIVADGIFPLMNHLMKPYSRRGLSAEETLFNKVLSNARVKVEHAFGMQSAKFRILRKELECSYRLSVDIVTALCNLHNLILPQSPNSPLPDVDEVAIHPYSTPQEQRDALKSLINE